MRLFPFLIALFIALSPGIAVNAAEPSAFRLFRVPNLDSGDSNGGGGNMVKWGPGPLGTPSEITYAFVTHSIDLDNMLGDCTALEPLDILIAKNNLEKEDFFEAAKAGLALWESAAGIRFRRVTDETRANLLIGSARRNLPITHARASLRVGLAIEEEVYALTKASICLDDDIAWSLFAHHLPGPTLSTKMLIAHEAGHVLGLDHPQDKNVVMGRSAKSTLVELTPGDREGARTLYGNP